MSVKSKTGNRPVFRTTDKCVQAEMKNKVEVARLQLQVKILDRQKSYSAFTVEKDKRQTMTTLARMRTTSGLSMHGVPPDGPGDRAHEDSPYFKSYRPLTEKRLIRWRAKERELQRMLQNEEDVLMPPWEKDPNEDTGEKFANMMRMLGYSVEDNDVRMLVKKEAVAASSEKSQNGFYRLHPVDPFECLRKDCNNGQIDDRVGFDLLKPKKFSVDDWNRRIVENYKRFVTANTSKSREARSAASRMEGNDVNTPTSGHKLAWTSSVNDATTRKGVYPRSPSTVVRPHTASGTSRHKIYREALKGRPSSAGHTSKAISSPYRRGSSGMRRTSVRASNQKEELDTVDELEKEISETDTINGKVVSEQTVSDEESILETSDNDLVVHPSRLNKQLTGQNEGIVTQHLSNKPTSINSEKETDSKMSTRDSIFLINTLLNADKKRQNKPTKVSFSDEQANDEPPKATKSVKSVQQLVKLSKDGSKLAEYDMKVLEENLEDISGLKNNQVQHELFKRMPENRERGTRKDIHITKAERRIALHSHRRKKDIDPLDDVLDSDADDDDDDTDGGLDIVRRMPQWKRELMAEAPPGLFGPKSPAKVVVAMSKAQRKKELDALVKENISDVRKIVDQENARRIRDRLHIYFTIRKLNEAVGKVPANPDHSLL
ncbi:hypothetical protein LSH36_335g03007 [Paralvinella palmiformis]|uniref:Uncharacterized protein n=1 Tax=Paralvinella palmiformis TaxID=53620 RepID=A0AAD9N0J1_9ANNE|nr:hypothetical protein LSH36_335g03007 [Paralvinella palmiformis]